MKKFFVAATLAGLLASGIALAADYVVARSNAPTITKGMQYGAGDTVPLLVGQLLTLISSGGEIVVLRGAEGGVRLPPLAKGAQTASMAALTALVNRPAPRRNFGAMRGKEGCPAVEILSSMEGILAASAIEGCAGLAREALERYIIAGEGGTTSAPAGAKQSAEKP